MWKLFRVAFVHGDVKYVAVFVFVQFPTTKKKGKIYCDCIIHCSNSTDKLVSSESWNVILRAAEIRNHKAVLDVSKEIDSSTILDIKYHRRYRSIFTLKKELDSLSCKAGSSSGSYSKRTMIYFLFSAAVLRLVV